MTNGCKRSLRTYDFPWTKHKSVPSLASQGFTLSAGRGTQRPVIHPGRRGTACHRWRTISRRPSNPRDNGLDLGKRAGGLMRMNRHTNLARYLRDGEDTQQDLLAIPALANDQRMCAAIGF